MAACHLMDQRSPWNENRVQKIDEERSLALSDHISQRHDTRSVCVCACGFVFVCVRLFVLVCIFVCVFVFVVVCVYLCIRECFCLCVRVCACQCVYLCGCMRVRVCLCGCVCVSCGSPLHPPPYLASTLSALRYTSPHHSHYNSISPPPCAP